MLGPVVAAILSGGVDLHRFTRDRKKFKFVLTHIDDAPDEWTRWFHTLEAIIDYVRIKKELPGGIERLKEFAALAPRLPGTPATLTDKYRDIITPAINEAAHELSAGLIKPTTQYDIEVALVLDQARRQYVARTYSLATKICAGSVPLGKGQSLSGVADAQRFVREQLLHDNCADSGSIEGDFAENLLTFV